MSPSLSDQEVLNMMNIAKDNLQKFTSEKPKGRKLKEALEKIKLLLPKASLEEQKVLLDKLVEVKKQLEIEEAANPAQQAAIAINMKKQGKKPKMNIEESQDYLPEA